MLNKKLAFKQLRNGKEIRLSWKSPDEIIYTIFLKLHDGIYYFHYYYFDGNDVFDEESYKDEHTHNYSDFNNLYETLVTIFPGVDQ